MPCALNWTDVACIAGITLVIGIAIGVILMLRFVMAVEEKADRLSREMELHR